MDQNTFNTILYEFYMGEMLMNKIYLYLMNIETKNTWFKYFETEFEKDKYKRKVRHIKNLLIIEDSSDMNWNYS